MGKRIGPVICGLCAVVPLVCLAAATSAYDSFLPLRSYTPTSVFLMSPQEGLFLALYTVLGSVAIICLAVAAFRLVPWQTSAALKALVRRVRLRWWVLGLAAVAALASIAIRAFVLGGTFLTDDEMAMLFQARVLLSGALSVDPSPAPRVLEYAMMIESPRWYGMYPIGHPAALAASILVTGSPHVIVALMSAGLVALTVLLARRLFGRTTGVLAGGLLLTSPFFLFTSASLASEVTSGVLILGATYVAIRIDRSRPLLMACGLGLLVGAAFIVRPYTALVISLILAALIVRLWLKGRIPVWSPLAILLCAVPFAALYLWTNSETTGSPWVTPYAINFPSARLGFGQDAFGIVHTPELALTVTGLAVVGLNAWTLGWPLSLLPVACGLFLKRPRGRTIVVALAPLLLLIAFFPVPSGGVHDTGPLYYFEILPFLVILAARGLIVVGRRASSILHGRGQELVTYSTAASILVAALFFSGQQVVTLRSIAEFNDAPYDVAERIIDGEAVVFVQDMQTAPPSSWVLGNRPPHPDLSDRIIYGKAPPRELAVKVLRQLPERQGYYMSRDHRTGDVSLIPLPAPPLTP